MGLDFSSAKDLVLMQLLVGMTAELQPMSFGQLLVNDKVCIREEGERMTSCWLYLP